MAYASFTFDDLAPRLGISVAQAALHGSVAPLDPGPWLLESLRRGGTAARFNEKSRSELIVAPILTRVGDFLGPRYAVYSGAELNVDLAQGLNGECDFLLSRALPVPFLQSPVMVVVEAKKGDIEAGLPQCAAQMVGTRLYNAKAGHPTPRVYGTVTTGDVWRFCQLDDTVLTTDTDLYYLADLGKILGILVECMKGSDPQ